ncbi:MAG: SDR family oxidoreductase [Bacteroidota bacterium]
MKVLITGASKGIGFFLMQKLSAAGYEVFGTYCSTLPSIEYQPYFTKVDINNQTQVANWIKNSVSGDDEIILINCVGTNYNALAHKADIEKWKELIDINLIGTFRMISTILPYMQHKGFGRIINFSSVVAQKGIPGTSAYAASKSALWGLTKCIAVENAQKGITINNLNLGYFNIGMISEVPSEILASIKKNIPYQELGDPENILNAVKFLIISDYITGTSIDINGGLF